MIEADDEFGLAIQREGSKSGSESQVPLSSWNEQQPITGRLVMGASSLDYSEWNIDEKWSSQVRKSDEMSKTSAGRPVYDKLVIGIDMDSDTAEESDFSLNPVQSCTV